MAAPDPLCPSNSAKTEKEVEGSPATRWPASARSSVKSSPLRLRLASPHSTSGLSIRSLVTSRRSSTPSGTVPGAAAIAIDAPPPRGAVSQNPRPETINASAFRRLPYRLAPAQAAPEKRITRQKRRGRAGRYSGAPRGAWAEPASKRGSARADQSGDAIDLGSRRRRAG
uniref:Uncharacterized protein n=1 Tax=Arundo donax TaxID=35708 RepID=A0A0A9D033_ARUDO